MPMASELVQGTYYGEGVIPDSSGARHVAVGLGEVRWCGVGATMQRW